MQACKSKCYFIGSSIRVLCIAHSTRWHRHRRRRISYIFYTSIYKSEYLPATVILAVPLIRLKWGPSLDTSHLYTPDVCGRSCSSLTLHCVSSQLNFWSANVTPSTVKFMYLGTISGAYLFRQRNLKQIDTAFNQMLQHDATTIIFICNSKFIKR